MSVAANGVVVSKRPVSLGGSGFLIWIVAIPILVLILSPVWGLFLIFSKDTFVNIWSESSLFKALAHSMAVSSLTALIGTFIGFVTAWVFARHDFKLKSSLRFLVLFPYLVPNFLWAIIYSICWNPQSGLANFFLPENLQWNCYGFAGLIVVMVLTHFQSSFLLLDEKLRSLDGNLEEAAYLSGAGRVQTFLKIIMPQILSTILLSFGLTFVLSLSAFGIPAWLGLPARYSVLTTKVYELLQSGGIEGLSDGVAVAIGLFIIAIVYSLAEYFVFRRVIAKDAKVKTQGYKVKKLFGIKSYLPALGFIPLLGVFWIIPFLFLVLSTLVPFDVLKAWSAGGPLFESVSLARYKYVLFELPDLGPALWGSFVVGGGACLAILFLSGFIAYFAKKSALLKNVFEGSLNILSVSAGAVIAIGLMVVGSGKLGFVLVNTVWILALAFVVKHLMLCYRPLVSLLSSVSESEIEAAVLSGVSTRQLPRKFFIPRLRAGLVSIFIFVFIPILGELSMSVFLVGPNVKTLGSVLFELHDYADQTSAMVLAVLLVALITALNLSVRFLSRGKLGF